MIITPIERGQERFRVRKYRDDDRYMIEATDLMTGFSYEWPDYGNRGWAAAEQWCESQQIKRATIFKEPDDENSQGENAPANHGRDL